MAVATTKQAKQAKGERDEPAPPRTPRFTLEFFVDDDGKPLVRDWLRGLSLTKRQR